MLTLSSCLVDDPPPFPESKQTPPRLDDHRALPRNNQIIFAQSAETVHFNVPVASEDAGDDLTALLFVNYKGGPAAPVAGDSVGASTLNDTTRSVDLNWLVTVPNPGCYRLTLRVTHSLNIDTSHFPGVQDERDLAEANWLAMIDADAAPGTTVASCP